MAEQSTPQAGLEQAPAPTPEQRLSTFFAQETAREQHKAMPGPKVEAEAPAPAEQQEPAPQEADQAPPEEAAPEDKPDLEPQAPEEEQSADGELWKIVHNGTEVTLNREEMIRHAQQGFDYDRKSQALAEERKQTQAMLQQASQLRQVAPQLQAELIHAQSLIGQLKQWENVDWVKLATEEPLDYPKYRAQYDQLERAARQAATTYMQHEGEYTEAEKALRRQRMAQEMQRLPDIEPDFRKPEVRQKVMPEITDYLLKRGIPQELIDSVDFAPVVAVAYDGMRYRKLIASKGAVEKQVRAAAPMSKPAAAQSPQSVVQRDYGEARARLKKSGSVDDAARLLAGLGAGNRK